jgi:hypothetical protein
MKSFYHFNPLTVVHKLHSKDIINWGKIYNLINNTIIMNDRTGQFKQPINLEIHPRCKLPILSQSSIDYDECADIRAKELYDLSAQMNKPLGIMWSGGIDSTMILVSFLRNYSLQDLKGRIKIITSTEAILENPKFYKTHLLPNFEFISSEYSPWIFDSSMIIVTGELNDQLFGSDMIRGFLATNGADFVNGTFNRNQLFIYIDSKIKDGAVSNILIDAIINASKTYGVTLEKNNDFFWWYNFCFKWQCVTFRLYALASPKFFSTIDQDWNNQYLHHFYQTEEFQLWSINNPSVRYITDWKNYKYRAKESIFAFNRDNDYFINKIKRPSLQTVFYQRKVTEAITTDFELMETFNPTEFYNPENPFQFS